MDRAQIAQAFRKGRIEWQRHALEKMMERQISRKMVKEVLVSGDLVEDYPDQRPYPGALLLGWVGAEPLHVVIAYNSADGICLVITAYVPDLKHFEKDYRTRRQREN